jgi:hypothetical protein
VLLTVQTVVSTVGGGLPYKIMYLFTGSSDKMLFQVMKNDHVVIACADFRLRKMREDPSLVSCSTV